MHITQLDLSSHGSRTTVSLVAVAPSLGYANVALSKVECVDAPRDGMQDFVLHFTPPCGPIVLPMLELFPLAETFETPSWFQGVRIRTSTHFGQLPRTLRSLQEGGKPIGDDAVFINGGRISGDKLIMSVSYSGGCELNHALQLDWDGALLKSNPPKANLTLSHNSFGDPCDALLSEEATFDLSTVRALLDSGIDQLFVRGDNTIVVPVARDRERPRCPDSFSKLEDWNAFDNRMPPGRSFYVSGTVVVPTGGYSVALNKSVPQGINPAVLLLDLTVTKPSGPATQVIEHLPVRYEEPEYTGTYSSVHVRCGLSIVLDLHIQTIW